MDLFVNFHPDNYSSNTVIVENYINNYEGHHSLNQGSLHNSVTVNPMSVT